MTFFLSVKYILVYVFNISHCFRFVIKLVVENAYFNTETPEQYARVSLQPNKSKVKQEGGERNPEDGKKPKPILEFNAIINPVP